MRKFQTPSETEAVHSRDNRLDRDNSNCYSYAILIVSEKTFINLKPIQPRYALHIFAFEKILNIEDGTFMVAGI